jgi:hypothetical protein
MAFLGGEQGNNGRKAVVLGPVWTKAGQDHAKLVAAEDPRFLQWFNPFAQDLAFLRPFASTSERG